MMLEARGTACELWTDLGLGQRCKQEVEEKSPREVKECSCPVALPLNQARHQVQDLEAAP